MKNWIYILMIGMMGSLVSSCQQSLDEEVQLPVATGKAQITFTIALDDIDSRATWEDNEGSEESTIGSVYENQIDLSSEDGLQVFVYDLNGALMGEVTDKEVRKVSDNEYSFNGSLTIENLTSSSLPCRLMVYANCINGNETFGYNVQYIPMWGVKQTTLQLAKGELTKLTEPIYLLRSMAKVEVKLDASIAENFDLTSVSVDKYNATGYVLPTYQTLTDTEDMDQELVFNPNFSLSENSLTFIEGSEDTFYVYLPEYQNVGEGASPATMKLMVDGREYILEFKDYASNTPFDIVRNHYYQYVIMDVNTVENVLVTELLYQSMPWTDVDNGELEFN